MLFRKSPTRRAVNWRVRADREKIGRFSAEAAANDTAGADILRIINGALPSGEARRMHQNQKNVSITSVTRYDGSTTNT